MPALGMGYPAGPCLSALAALGTVASAALLHGGSLRAALAGGVLTVLGYRPALSVL